MQLVSSNNPIHEFRLCNTENEMYCRGKLGQEVVTVTFWEFRKSSGEAKKNIKVWFDYFNAIDIAKDVPEYIKEACNLATNISLGKRTSLFF